jgi:transcriptional regulator with XRE-family HTH domain
MEQRGVMLTTGSQLKAARALTGMTRTELANLARLNVSTIAEMEARAGETLRSSFETVRAVQKVLEAAGVEFLNGKSPGVRLRTKG